MHYLNLERRTESSASLFLGHFTGNGKSRFKGGIGIFPPSSICCSLPDPLLKCPLRLGDPLEQQMVLLCGVATSGKCTLVPLLIGNSFPFMQVLLRILFTRQFSKDIQLEYKQLMGLGGLLHIIY